MLMAKRGVFMVKSINSISEILDSLKELNKEAEILDKEAEIVVNNNRRLLLFL